MIRIFHSNISRALAYINMFSGQNKWMDVDKVREELAYCRNQLDCIIRAMDAEYGPPDEERAEEIHRLLVYNRERKFRL